MMLPPLMCFILSIPQNTPAALSARHVDTMYNAKYPEAARIVTLPSHPIPPYRPSVFCLPTQFPTAEYQAWFVDVRLGSVVMIAA